MGGSRQQISTVQGRSTVDSSDKGNGYQNSSQEEVLRELRLDRFRGHSKEGTMSKCVSNHSSTYASVCIWVWGRG